MVKKSILYIFIYTLMVGCGTNNVLNDGCESDCYLDVEAPDLQIDENGYYHIEWLDGYNQTFSTLDADTGSDNQILKIYWTSDAGVEYGGYWNNSVNAASYTNNGLSHTVLSVWGEQVGDTITVSVWYRDFCDYEHTDNLKVVIDNEI